MRICNNCGSNIPDGAETCYSCGQKAETARLNDNICKKCGAKISNSDSFCGVCGAQQNTQMLAVNNQQTELINQNANIAELNNFASGADSGYKRLLPLIIGLGAVAIICSMILAYFCVRGLQPQDIIIPEIQQSGAEQSID